MAYELHNGRAFPGIAASAILGRSIVRVASGAGAPQRGVAPVLTTAELPLGVTGEAPAAVGRGITVLTQGNHVKVRAAASVGVGGLVGVASGPAGASGLLAPGVASGAFAVGEATTAAQAGEYFTVHVNPQRA